MSRAKRTQTPKIEVHLLREGIGESIHYVEATVCDNRNRTLLVAGDPQSATFIRSALKPFQALAVTTTGTIERYGLTDKDLAIICSSHRGTIAHSRQVFNILWSIDVEANTLKCPIPEGRESALQHNCSGKHAGMLAVCRQLNWTLNDYLDRSHPVQKLILNKIAEILGMPGDEMITARDDCGAPTYFMQIQQMAYLYAQLASGSNLDLERIVRAVTHYPDMISGDGYFDTELMKITEGQLVSKSGAEGIQCIGRVGEGQGLAIKVADGAKRAKYAVAIHLLKQMGWISPAIAEHLADQFMKLSNCKRLEVIGELCLV